MSPYCIRNISWLIRTSALAQGFCWLFTCYFSSMFNMANYLYVSFFLLPSLPSFLSFFPLFLCRGNMAIFQNGSQALCLLEWENTPVRACSAQQAHGCSAHKSQRIYSCSLLLSQNGMALHDLFSGVVLNPEYLSLNKCRSAPWRLRNGKDTQRSQVHFGANKWGCLPEKLFALSMCLLHGQ